MANDKDFILKNAVEVGGPTNVTLGTVTSDDIDLSTGNYFKDTPTGTSTYTISNAGDVQSFQLEVTGGTAEVAQNFSTTLYTGNGSTQTITNGIDLANDGGLVWTKDRDTAVYHALTDTERGGQYALYSPVTDAQVDRGSDFITSFNSNGYSIGADGLLNDTYNYVSWTFKKAAGFFDIVTYTGDGVAGREIAHNLGTTVGTLIIKSTSNTGDWKTWHRSLSSTQHIKLNSTAAATTLNTAAFFGDDTSVIAPTDSVFTIGSSSPVNLSGATYVAYLFAHDTAADSLIKCGSYTGNGSTSGPTVTLGWEPQWLLLKNASTGGTGWIIVDTERNLGSGNDYILQPQSSGAEITNLDYYTPSSTGFQVVTTADGANTNGDTYIYIAIRASSLPAITWPSSIEWAGGVAPAAPAVGETDVFTITTDDGGTTYTGVKTADNLS